MSADDPPPRARDLDGEGADPLLSVEGLRTRIRTPEGRLAAVDDVDLTVSAGEIVCLVGESGSGKTVTCESLTGIVPQPPAEIVGGTVEFDGTDLLAASPAERRRVRGDRIGHVFQNPQRALDPVATVGSQIAETMTIHGRGDADTRRERARELLAQVGIASPGERLEAYPHELSGGMQQRVAIAIALAADPDVVIADEPTTAVDVTVQARLLSLLSDLAADGTGLLVVTHDLRVVAALADRVLVMFGGTVVERGTTESVLETPGHPYTQGLVRSFRGEATDDDEGAVRRDVPTGGCRFREQCPYAVTACEGPDRPPLYHVEGDGDHRAACVYHDGEHDPSVLAHEDDPEEVTGDGQR